MAAAVGRALALFASASSADVLGAFGKVTARESVRGGEIHFVSQRARDLARRGLDGRGVDLEFFWKSMLGRRTGERLVLLDGDLVQGVSVAVAHA